MSRVLYFVMKSALSLVFPQLITKLPPLPAPLSSIVKVSTRLGRVSRRSGTRATSFEGSWAVPHWPVWELKTSS